MTDQSSNDQFHASSFMQGHNAEYLEQLYAQYANDPNAVDAAWQRGDVRESGAPSCGMAALQRCMRAAHH